MPPLELTLLYSATRFWSSRTILTGLVFPHCIHTLSSSIQIWLPLPSLCIAKPQICLWLYRYWVLESFIIQATTRYFVVITNVFQIQHSKTWTHDTNWIVQLSSYCCAWCCLKAGKASQTRMWGSLSALLSTTARIQSITKFYRFYLPMSPEPLHTSPPCFSCRSQTCLLHYSQSEAYAK